MFGISLIYRYFPHLNDNQKEQFAALQSLYESWNKKINLISRKDIEFLYLHHVLHSLAIAKLISFKAGAEIMDLGTGGGFPGIPLAISFPDAKFTLIDSIGKKIKVVDDISQSLNLKNISAVHERAENINAKFDFIVARAAAPLSDLVQWTSTKFKKDNVHHIPNGLLCLKGGDLADELSSIKNKAHVYEINKWFTEDFFSAKKLIYLPFK